MKIGVFGGGFKPLTSGHFSKVALALSENDIVILYYGIASREKGSGYKYTRGMARMIYDIMVPAIQRELGAMGVEVREGVPTPIVRIFKLIEAIKDRRDNDLTSLQSLGIDPNNVESITVYSDPKDSQAFLRHMGGPHEQKYYGDLYKQGILRFDSGLSGDYLDDMSRITCAMERFYSNVSPEELERLARIRGSEVRQFILDSQTEAVKQYLPPFLNDEELNGVIDILMSGCSLPVQSETYFRELLKGMRRG